MQTDFLIKETNLLYLHCDMMYLLKLQKFLLQHSKVKKKTLVLQHFSSENWVYFSSFVYLRTMLSKIS